MDRKVSEVRARLKRAVVQLCPVIVLSLMAMLVVFLPSNADAQSSSGAISGTVTDTSGAVVPGATVTVTNLGTNEVHAAQTGASGEYRVVDLVPANYKVDVEASSFKHFVQASVPVQVDTTVRVDAKLEVGAATETVEVTTQVPMLQTESGTVGSEVEGRVVQDMPLNGRNVMNLLALAPGVVPQQNTSGAPAINGGIHMYVNGWGNYAIGGGIANESAQYIDGAPNNVLGGNPPALIMTQDMVQEFKVESNAVSAEYGHFGGGVVNMASKSGTNAFHGSIYEYVRNTLLNTNDFVSKNNGKSKAPYHQNQYGAIIGGPIKKDKAFFMFSWEDQSIHTPIPVQRYVPTLAERGVDPAYPGGVAVRNALNDSSGAIKAACPNVILSGYTSTYQAFIPNSCIDSASKVLEGFYAYPNVAATGTNTNFFSQTLTGSDSWQYNTRIDFNVSNKQRVFGRWTKWHIATIGEDDFKGQAGHDPSVPSDFGSNYNDTNNIVLGDTYTFNASTIGDLRVSYMRDHFDNYSSARGNFNLTALGGDYPSLANQVSTKEVPNFLLPGGNESGPWDIPVGANQTDIFEAFGLNASVTKIHGNHSFKIGMESQLRNHSGGGNYSNDAGQAIFLGPVFGDAWGAFMLGEFLSDQIHTTKNSFSIDWSHGAYFTDTWRATPKLTLNYGVRWDFPGGLYEKKDRATVFLPTVVDPNAKLPGTLALTNSPVYPSRDMSPSRLNLFGPRFSFAYSVSNNLVVRGGYGLSYIPPDMPIGLMAFSSPVNGADTTCPGFAPGSFSHPFRCVNNTIIQPLGRTDPNPGHVFFNQFVTSPVPTNKYPYMQQWNVSLGKQWSGSVETDITYAGSKGTQLPISGLSTGTSGSYYSIDQLSPQYYSLGVGTGPAQGQSTGGTGLSAVQPCAALGGQLVTVGRCLQPFPQYQGVFNTGAVGGTQNYNALYLTFAKRFGSGGVLNANYTWSRTMGDTDQPGFGGGGSWQNFYNPRGEYSIASFDVPNRLIINYVIDLPFGRGHHWLNHGGLANTVVGGWQVNGIVTEQSGFPYSFTYNSPNGNLFQSGNTLTNAWGAGVARPDIVPGCNLRTSDNWLQKFKNKTFFNQNCIVAPGTNYTNAVLTGPNPPTISGQQQMLFGNAPRNTAAVRSQFLDNFDFTLSKATQIHESVNLQFKAETFNLFNHPVFGNADSLLGDNPSNYATTAGSQFPLVGSAPNRLLQLSLRLNF